MRELSWLYGPPTTPHHKLAYQVPSQCPFTNQCSMLVTPTDVHAIFTSPSSTQPNRKPQKTHPISFSFWAFPLPCLFRHMIPLNPIYTTQHFLPLFSHFKPCLPIFAHSSQKYLTSQPFYLSSFKISLCPNSISLIRFQITQASLALDRVLGTLFSTFPFLDLKTI
jgi:hypothetical protein